MHAHSVVFSFPSTHEGLSLVLALLLILIFHFLMLGINPIFSLFAFLFFIVLQATTLVLLGYIYLAFVLVSVYGGAIVVLFLLVAMLFNKKLKH